MTTSNNKAFIGRQPVLNRNQQLIGYELFFRADSSDNSIGQHAELEADTDVLVNLLNNMGTQSLVGNKLAFLNVGETMLQSEFLELLPSRRIVLDLSNRVRPSQELVSRLKHLRSLGFGVALDGFSFDSPQQALLEVASYAKLDVQGNAQQFQLAAARLKSYPLVRLAERVETYEQFHMSRELGLDGFQGFFFAKPETLSAVVIDPGAKHILDLLNLIRQEASVSDLENILKQDVALSYKLLRYVNSAAAGLNTTIRSFAHAVTVLGYQKLYRWLTLLLVTANADKNAIQSALQRSAIARGRYMELMGMAKGLAPEASDTLFIIGMFSQLDALFDMPMERVLQHLQLPEAVTLALESRSGPYGAYLELAILSEQSKETPRNQVMHLAAELELSADVLNQTQLSALAWVEELGL
jgi:EAL and modified HD-GYP domain-containing signal transduction protein